MQVERARRISGTTLCRRHDDACCAECRPVERTALVPRERLLVVLRRDVDGELEVVRMETLSFANMFQILKESLPQPRRIALLHVE